MLRRLTVLALVFQLSPFPGGSGDLSAQEGVPGPPPWSPLTFAAAALTNAPSTTEGALTLLLPIGAQGVGMGRAMTAISGPEAVFWNPAGLAQLQEGRFSVFRGEHLAGEATGLSLIFARQPLGVLAVSYHLLDLGNSVLKDAENNTIGSISFRDHLAVISFGTRVLPGLDTGVNFKVFQERITCRGQCTDAEVTGTSYAVDAGIQAMPIPTLPLRIGLMVAHAGPDLQIINVEQADPLPTRIRAAVAYEVLQRFIEEAGLELWMVAEVEDRWRNLASRVWYLGSEFLVGEEDLFFLRMGYGQEHTGGTWGASVGLGLQYDRFEVAMAKSLAGTISEASEPVHVSFGVVF